MVAENALEYNDEAVDIFDGMVYKSVSPTWSHPLAYGELRRYVSPGIEIEITDVTLGNKTVDPSSYFVSKVDTSPIATVLPKVNDKNYILSMQAVADYKELAERAYGICESNRLLSSPHESDLVDDLYTELTARVLQDDSLLNISTDQAGGLVNLFRASKEARSLVQRSFYTVSLFTPNGGVDVIYIEGREHLLRLLLNEFKNQIMLDSAKESFV